MNEVYELNRIRQQISERFQKNPGITINVALKKPKLNLSGVPVRIVGVYPHIFQVEEETAAGEKKRHTLQYTDVFLHNIEILDF